jgi:1-acyl-sn-glycerol-3-phosphate acyltransferase
LIPPVVNTLLRSLSMALLRLGGWKVEGSLPPQAAKSVLIAAPHTSNWDLPYTLMLAFVLNLRVYWMGKQSIFRAPFGGLMRWLGGIPVNRSQNNNLVASSAQAMREAEGPMQLIIPPEGTRGKTRHWKNGLLLHRPAGRRSHRAGICGTMAARWAAWGRCSSPRAT